MHCLPIDDEPVHHHLLLQQFIKNVEDSNSSKLGEACKYYKMNFYQIGQLISK